MNQPNCEGCGALNSTFRCPECIGVAHDHVGFFCGQSCFAKVWTKHRNLHHLGAADQSLAKKKAKKISDRNATKTDEYDVAMENCLANQNAKDVLDVQREPNCLVRIHEDGTLERFLPPSEHADSSCKVSPPENETLSFLSTLQTVRPQLFQRALEAALRGDTMHRIPQDPTSIASPHALASVLDLLRKVGRANECTTSLCDFRDAQLFLIAVLSFLDVMMIPHPILDELAALYGIPHLVRSPPHTESLSTFLVMTNSTTARFLTLLRCVILYFIDENEQAGKRVTLENLEQQLGWTLLGLQALWGPLRKYLSHCRCFELIRLNNQGIFLTRLREDTVPVFTVIPLPRAKVAAELAQTYRKMAVEEILNYLPISTDRSIALGNLGDRIGMKWGLFNLRYEGVLGPTLKRFLVQHPAHFSVEGRRVFRVAYSSIIPVTATQPRMKRSLSNDEEDGASPNDYRTAKKKRSPKSKSNEVHLSRQDKRRALNRARFNKNARKQMPIDARVPGFRPGALVRKKGRGTKPSLRHYKRSL